MRRIPRPSRAIDPSKALHSSVRQRISSLSCRYVVAPCSTYLRTSTAAFSSTPAKTFLLPAKQDKKKHQQFVRRWQKRLLGDSEPIGAHVDPYDPTSPVRIAPEEQGEYEEVLDEEDIVNHGKADVSHYHHYTPAEESGRPRPGARLMHIGGEKWLQQKLEGDMAKEFEKLTMQTYTPLSLDMANEIEELTGTPYTLHDGNLMMAQTVHAVTGRPYTRYNFGLHGKSNKADSIRNRFAQAVAEVYALKEAGLDMDLAKSPNRGVYRSPRWVRDIKLQRTESGELTLAYPAHKNAELFIQAIQEAPEWESTPVMEYGEVLVDDAADLLEPILPQEPALTMDPATPAFKRAAVVKIDPEKKPFDFMSNRPVPRVKPAEIEKVQEIVKPVAESVAFTPSRLIELMTASETSQSVINGLRHSILEHRAQRIAENIAAMKKTTRNDKPSLSTVQAEEIQWRHVPITDLAVKFALFKRLFQLTGYRISDPHLSTSNTLGDLYGHLCDAAKPQPTTLFSAIHTEGQARQRAKQRNSNPAISRRRADLGDLITLGNVDLRRVKATKTEKRTQTGMNKVVQYALWERGLGRGLGARSRSKKKKTADAREGTRDVPEFGRPLSSKSASRLMEWTKAKTAA